MGCGTSKSKVVAIGNLDEFFSELIATGYPDGTHKDDLPKEMQETEAFLDRITKPADREKIANYFRRLIKKTPGTESVPEAVDYRLFQIATTIMKKTEQVWMLNERTLVFFGELAVRDEAAFNLLMAEFKNLCTTNQLFLKDAHIDTVIASLDKHTQLPNDSLRTLNAYLDDERPDIQRIVKHLRDAHRPELTRTASIRSLVHHDIPHAKEIKRRSEHVFRTIFNLCNTDSINSQEYFFRKVACLMIELHDLVQKDPGEYASVELATAARVVSQLTGALNIIDNPGMIKIIELMADQIIVTGTTLIFSPKHTADLSQILDMVKRASSGPTLSADVEPVDADVSRFKDTLEIVSLVTGVCDKTPTAILGTADFDDAVGTPSPLPLIKEYCATPETPTILENFFTSQHFTPFFRGEVNISWRRFLISLVPHMSMRAELCADTEEAKTYMSFIRECREARRFDDRTNFRGWYDRHFTEKNMSKVMQTLFFSNIAKEAGFSRSQATSLTVVRNRLAELLPLVGRDYLKARLFTDPMIDPEIPNRDARNLEGLKLYSDSLSPSQKDLLYRELFLVATLQAGAISKVASSLSAYNMFTRTPTTASGGLAGAGAMRQGPTQFTFIPTEASRNRPQRTFSGPAIFFDSSPAGSTSNSKPGSTPGSDPSELLTPTAATGTPSDLAVIVDGNELDGHLSALSQRPS